MSEPAGCWWPRKGEAVAPGQSHTSFPLGMTCLPTQLNKELQEQEQDEGIRRTSLNYIGDAIKADKICLKNPKSFRGTRELDFQQYRKTLAQICNALLFIILPGRPGHWRVCVLRVD